MEVLVRILSQRPLEIQSRTKMCHSYEFKTYAAKMVYDY